MLKVVPFATFLLVVLLAIYVESGALEHWQQVRGKHLANRRESVTSIFAQDFHYEFVRPQVNPFTSKKDLESAMENDPFGNFSPRDYVVNIVDVVRNSKKEAKSTTSGVAEVSSVQLNTRVIQKKEKKIVKVSPAENMEGETTTHEVELDYDVELMPGLVNPDYDESIVDIKCFSAYWTQITAFKTGHYKSWIPGTLFIIPAEWNCDEFRTDTNDKTLKNEVKYLMVMERRVVAEDDATVTLQFINRIVSPLMMYKKSKIHFSKKRVYPAEFSNGTVSENFDTQSTPYSYVLERDAFNFNYDRSSKQASQAELVNDSHPLVTVSCRDCYVFLGADLTFTLQISDDWTPEKVSVVFGGRSAFKAEVEVALKSITYSKELFNLQMLNSQVSTIGFNIGITRIGIEPTLMLNITASFSAALESNFKVVTGLRFQAYAQYGVEFDIQKSQLNQIKQLDYEGPTFDPPRFLGSTNLRMDVQVRMIPAITAKVVSMVTIDLSLIPYIGFEVNLGQNPCGPISAAYNTYFGIGYLYKIGKIKLEFKDWLSFLNYLAPEEYDLGGLLPYPSSNPEMRDLLSKRSLTCSVCSFCYSLEFYRTVDDLKTLPSTISNIINKDSVSLPSNAFSPIVSKNANFTIAITQRTAPTSSYIYFTVSSPTKVLYNGITREGNTYGTTISLNIAATNSFDVGKDVVTINMYVYYYSYTSWYLASTCSVQFRPSVHADKSTVRMSCTYDGIAYSYDFAVTTINNSKCGAVVKLPSGKNVPWRLSQSEGVSFQIMPSTDKNLAIDNANRAVEISARNTQGSSLISVTDRSVNCLAHDVTAQQPLSTYYLDPSTQVFGVNTYASMNINNEVTLSINDFIALPSQRTIRNVSIASTTETLLTLLFVPFTSVKQITGIRDIRGIENAFAFSMVNFKGDCDIMMYSTSKLVNRMTAVDFITREDFNNSKFERSSGATPSSYEEYDFSTSMTPLSGLVQLALLDLKAYSDASGLVGLDFYGSFFYKTDIFSLVQGVNHITPQLGYKYIQVNTLGVLPRYVNRILLDFTTSDLQINAWVYSGQILDALSTPTKLITVPPGSKVFTFDPKSALLNDGETYFMIKLSKDDPITDIGINMVYTTVSSIANRMFVEYHARNYYEFPSIVHPGSRFLVTIAFKHQISAKVCQLANIQDIYIVEVNSGQNYKVNPLLSVLSCTGDQLRFTSFEWQVKSSIPTTLRLIIEGQAAFSDAFSTGATISVNLDLVQEVPSNLQLTNVIMEEFTIFKIDSSLLSGYQGIKAIFTASNGASISTILSSTDVVPAENNHEAKSSYGTIQSVEFGMAFKTVFTTVYIGVVGKKGTVSLVLQDLPKPQVQMQVRIGNQHTSYDSPQLYKQLSVKDVQQQGFEIWISSTQDFHRWHWTEIILSRLSFTLGMIRQLTSSNSTSSWNSLVLPLLEQQAMQQTDRTQVGVGAYTIILRVPPVGDSFQSSTNQTISLQNYKSGKYMESSDTRDFIASGFDIVTTDVPLSPPVVPSNSPVKKPSPTPTVTGLKSSGSPSITPTQSKVTPVSSQKPPSDGGSVLNNSSSLVLSIALLSLLVFFVL